MSRYKNTRFNFSHMSERLTFQTQNPDGSYTDKITVWAHILKDGFTRSETDNFYKIMIREQRALDSLLEVNNRLKWKNRLFSIFSWQDPSYEDRGFIEIIAKQISVAGSTNTDGDLFKDIVSIFRQTKIATVKFGLPSYEFKYDFNIPNFEGVRCHFSTDRNMFVDDKRTDTEHDSLIVKFNAEAPIQIEDYIESPVHGRFRIEMITKNDDNMLEAKVSRSEVQ